jgi:hypothetical protein
MPQMMSGLAAIKPTDLPVPPGASIQVVRACSRPEITHKQLAVADPDERLCLEGQLFGMSHTQVGHHLAGTWACRASWVQPSGAITRICRTRTAPRAS